MHLQYLLNLGSRNFSYVGSGQQKISGSASAFPSIALVVSNVNLKLSIQSTIVFNPNQTITSLTFKPYDIGFDSNASQWRILEIFGVNGSFVYKACNGNKSRYFNEGELFTQSQIVEIYNNKVDYEINCLLNKYEDILNT
jgi:hypothetical protein